MLKTITQQDLVCMDDCAQTYHYRVELAYAKNDNLLFGEQIYRDNAKLWLHKDLAQIVFSAAKDCFKKHNTRFVLHDGLRTVDAQKAMLNTKRVRRNPHWLEEPVLLSSPGSGGHPRGMAIDISLEKPDGELLDMGTAFDYLAENPDDNPAHRDYAHSQKILDNREILNECMIKAAGTLNIPLLPLPQEWWDFRLPPEIYEQYAPLSDHDLPAHIRLLNI